MQFGHIDLNIRQPKPEVRSKSSIKHAKLLVQLPPDQRPVANKIGKRMQCLGTEGYRRGGIVKPPMLAQRRLVNRLWVGKRCHPRRGLCALAVD